MRQTELELDDLIVLRQQNQKAEATGLRTLQRNGGARRPRRRGTRANVVSFPLCPPPQIFSWVFSFPSLISYFTFRSTENFYREKEKKKEQLLTEVGTSLYQERRCKRVETRMSVRFFECTLMSRLSNKYVSFFLYINIYTYLFYGLW